MKIVVMGGAGQVGSQCVRALGADGVEVVPASRRTGVDLMTGAGLDAVLEGANVVIDVANSPSFDDRTVLSFFDTATRNLLAAEAAAGVGHHVCVSIVGAERLESSGYFRAKLAQETLVKAAGIPFSILRATQFFEFLPEVVRSSASDGVVRLPPARVQFVAASDVAAALAALSATRPINGTIELAGPDADQLDALVRAYMAAIQDRRTVISDPEALYLGSRLANETLMAGDIPRFGHTDFATWLRQSVPRPAAPVRQAG